MMFVLTYRKKDSYFTRIRKSINLDEEVGYINNSGWEIVAVLKFNTINNKFYSIKSYFSDIYNKTKKVSKWEKILRILFEREERR